MIDLNGILEETFGTIQQLLPDAVVNGRLVKYNKVYDRATAKYVNTVADSQFIRAVFDYSEEMLRTSEHSDTIVSKIHVFGYLDKPVELFDEMVLEMSTGDETYKTHELRKINVGESSSLHTFIITR